MLLYIIALELPLELNLKATWKLSTLMAHYTLQVTYVA